MSNVQEIQNLQNMNTYLYNETQYKLDRDKFENDEDYLNEFLSDRFRKKIYKLKADEYWTKKVISF